MAGEPALWCGVISFIGDCPTCRPAASAGHSFGLVPTFLYLQAKHKLHNHRWLVSPESIQVNHQLSESRFRPHEQSTLLINQSFFFLKQQNHSELSTESTVESSAPTALQHLEPLALTVCYKRPFFICAVNTLKVFFMSLTQLARPKSYIKQI